MKSMVNYRNRDLLPKDYFNHTSATGTSTNAMETMKVMEAKRSPDGTCCYVHVELKSQIRRVEFNDMESACAFYDRINKYVRLRQTL